jgi:hypothetical protein
MIWLIIASVGLFTKLIGDHRTNRLIEIMGSFPFYLSLIAWFWLEADSKAFSSGESGLLGWFIIGLILFLIAELLPILKNSSRVMQGLAAVAFALGFDVFRPDDYSYVPGAILGVLVLAVAVQAYLRLARENKKTISANRIALAVYILSIGLLLYAATSKTIDRGWALPWAYLASVGAFLFAAGQVWVGWGTILKKNVTTPWVQIAAINVGQLLMSGAAFFVYREFL